MARAGPGAAGTPARLDVAVPLASRLEHRLAPALDIPRAAVRLAGQTAAALLNLRGITP
jgi:hypothetical protein